MAFTETELAYLRGVLGTDMDEDDLAERHARLRSIPEAAAEVLRERLADLLQQPTSLSISGVMSVSNAGRIAALQQAIAVADADAGYPAGGIQVGRVVRADPSR